MITLLAGQSEAQILPELGGALAGLSVGGKPVLRPWSGRVEDGPFALACNLLVPFSNRLSGGGFAFEGMRHSVAANLAGEACPLHGDGLQRPWVVAAQTTDRAALRLDCGDIGPFRYAATASYHLTAGALDTTLAVTNRGPVALPFGLGLHPWFPRDADTRLQFGATGHWPEGPDHLPTTRGPVAFDSGCPWQQPAPLPQAWINCGFSGWDGTAQIDQGAAAVSVRITSAGLGTALLYSPSARADFFCFEPVTHPVDAHNLPGLPGLVRLAPGNTLGAQMTLVWGQAT